MSQILSPRRLQTKMPQYTPTIERLLEWTQGRRNEREAMIRRFSALLASDPGSLFSGATIKVTGTNGKGSVCAMLEACFLADGRRVGIFTSPHLWDIRERFRIDGALVEEALIERHAVAVERAAHAIARRLGDGLRPSFFETLIIIASRLFREQGVEVAIFEGGVGGYSDAVSLLGGEVSILTTIALDHQDRLGPTLESIAADKVGMASDGSQLVLGPDISPHLRAILERDAIPRGVTVTQASHDGIAARARGRLPTEVTVSSGGATIDFTVPLLGRHQLSNLATVVAAVEVLSHEGILRDRRSLTGIGATVWAGRMELLGRSPGLLVDVAHNEEGMLGLADSLADIAPVEERVLLYGAGQEKDYSSCIKHLSRIAPKVYLVEGFHRATSTERLAEKLPADCELLGSFATVPAALEALTESLRPQGLVVCTGSVFLVGEVRHHLGASGKAQEKGSPAP